MATRKESAALSDAAAFLRQIASQTAVATDHHQRAPRIYQQSKAATFGQYARMATTVWVILFQWLLF